jgi:hypothetical protein
VGRRRSAADGSEEAAWQRIIEVSRVICGGRFTDRPHAFSPRIFVRPGMWRIPEPEDKIAIDDWVRRGLWSSTIINQRANHMAKIANSELPPAFPSSPSRPPRYGIRIKTAGSVNHIPLCELYAASKIVNCIIGGRKFQWEGDNEIAIDGMTISGDIEAAIEYKPTDRESKWQIPSPYFEMLSKLNGTSIEAPDPKPMTVDKIPSDRPKKDRKPKERKTAPEGMVSISDICAELNIAPAVARRTLRGTKEPKPVGGWNWPTAEVDRIKKLLTSA